MGYENVDYGDETSSGSMKHEMGQWVCKGKKMGRWTYRKWGTEARNWVYEFL